MTGQLVGDDGQLNLVTPACGPVPVGISALDLEAAVEAAATALGTRPGKPGVDRTPVRTAVLAAVGGDDLDGT